MKPIIACLLTLVCGCCCAADTKPVPGLDGTWIEDAATAMRLAQEQKRIVLADFTGSDWCSWCQKLDAEVFAKPEFTAWASRHVVLLRVDFPRSKPQAEALKAQNAALAKKYNVESYPTILFLQADGKDLEKNMGYEEGGAQNWIGIVNAVLGFEKK